MKKLIIMACTMSIMLALPIVANAGTVYLGNIAATNYNGGYMFPGAKGGYFVCSNDVQKSAGCQTTYIAVSSSGSGDTGGTQTNPTLIGNCTLSSCVCSYDYYVSGNTCKSCSSQSGRTNTVATSDGTYHTKTSCDECLSDKISLRPAAGIIACYCPDNGTCSNGNVTCNKNYYRTGSGGSGAYECTACEYGTKTDTVGATKHSQCCYPAGTIVDDKNKGKYKIKSKCCYSD